LKDCTILLISDYGADIERWRAAFKVHNPNLDLRAWSDSWDPLNVAGILVDTTMTSRGGYGQFSNLKWVSYLGHGAGDVLGDATLKPGVEVTRLKDQQLAEGLKLSALSSVLSHHQHILDYKGQQRQRRWERLECKPIEDFSIAVLGMGFIGAQIATLFCDHRFKVSAWSRTKKDIPNIASYSSTADLDKIIGQSDFVVAILPETNETKQLFDAQRFACFKPGAAFANLGRGSLVNEKSLLRAIENGQVHSAYLDVFETEPLPSDNELWSSERIIVTPHAGGGLGTSQHSVSQVAENYGRFIDGQPLVNLVSQAKGY
jgi:glyoxylate/hydroxypyruvate reductase